MPKLQINGTNDPYWTLDSMNLYWDDLKGPKYVVYLPNAGHDLKEHRDWATNGVGALFRHAASGRSMPDFSWKFRFRSSPDADNELATITLDTSKAKSQLKSIEVWAAASASRDFRQSKWERTFVESSVGSSTMQPLPGQLSVAMERSGKVVSVMSSRDVESAQSAVQFAVLTFEIDGLEYRLSTQIFVFDCKPAK